MVDGNAMAAHVLLQLVHEVLHGGLELRRQRGHLLRRHPGQEVGPHRLPPQVLGVPRKRRHSVLQLFQVGDLDIALEPDGGRGFVGVAAPTAAAHGAHSLQALPDARVIGRPALTQFQRACSLMLP